jgi:hypothetical protein
MENINKRNLSRRNFLRLAGTAVLGTLVSSCQGKVGAITGEQTTVVEEKPLAPASTEIKPVQTPEVIRTSNYFTSVEPPNSPLGKARGIQPGRVVWSHNPEATTWDGINGFWWQEEYLNYGMVKEMLAQSIRELVGQETDANAWQALFENFNQLHGKEGGYQPGEKIAIKLNQNAVTQYDYTGNHNFSSPQMSKALVELLLAAGIKPTDIVLFDSTRLVPDATYLKFQEAAFQGLQFVDFGGSQGRSPIQRDARNKIKWSEEVNGNTTYLPTCVTDAAYVINLASLKGHSLAGATLCAKNHFGTISADLDGKASLNAPQGANIHGTIAAHNFDSGPGWTWPQRKMSTYNALVDLMVHPHLGEKTLLFLIEGFYAVHEQNTPMTARNRWTSAPFNGHWPSSLLVSQDGVAIDSVGLDFLAAEPTIQKGGNLPAGSTCENYLHEAALADQPPSGVVYDPTGAGTTPLSLGVHEHWNSPDTKQYSRNLGSGEGIELVSIS